MHVLHTELISKCKLATLKSYKAAVSSINPPYFANGANAQNISFLIFYSDQFMIST